MAYWVKRLLVQALKAIRLDSLTKSAGLEAYLTKADIKMSTVDIIGTIVEWVIILIFFVAVVDILGLPMVSQVLGRVLSYIPNVLAAALIFATGYIVAGLSDAIIRGAVASLDKNIARPSGKFARWVILLVAFFAAVDQLQIAQGLIATFFQGLTYTVVLVVGLSVGLGAKDTVAKILNNWYEKISK